MNHSERFILFLSVVLLSLGSGGVIAAQNTQPQPAGVGIAFDAQPDGTIVVRSVLPGGPAERAGIRAGDELLSVNGKSVADIAAEDLTSLIRGAAGSEITLTVRTSGQRPRQATMRRMPMTFDPTQGSREPDPPEPAGRAPQGAMPTAPGPATADPKGTLRFTRISVRDPGINNVEAVSFLMPRGWKADGGIQWMPDYSVQANLLMKITDPQTGAQIEFLPLQNFTWLNQAVVPMQPGTNYLGNIIAPPTMDLPAFIRNFYAPQVLRQLQTARQLSIQDLPGIAAEAAKPLQGSGTAKSARIRYEYALGGRPWEEDVYVTLTYFQTPMSVIWSVTSGYSFRAPRGELDRLTPAMTTTIATLRLTEDWFGGYMYVQKLFMERMNQGIRNARAISDTVTRNSEEIRRMYADSYRQRSESMDRINRNFSEYIRGVETYTNPFESTQIQLPSGYNDAWVNARGEYLLSNDANFNPNIGDNADWRRMNAK